MKEMESSLVSVEVDEMARTAVEMDGRVKTGWHAGQEMRDTVVLRRLRDRWEG